MDIYNYIIDYVAASPVTVSTAAGITVSLMVGTIYYIITTTTQREKLEEIVAELRSNQEVLFRRATDKVIDLTDEVTNFNVKIPQTFLMPSARGNASSFAARAYRLRPVGRPGRMSSAPS